MKILQTTACILFASFTLAHADVSFDFNDQTAFDSNFPAGSGNNENDSNRWLYGDESSVALDSGSLKMRSDSSSAESSSVTIYSNIAYSSDFDFVSDAKKLRFDGLTMRVPSGGSTYITNFGIANDHTGNLVANSGPDHAIFFRLNRNNTAELVQKFNDTSTTLGSWDLGFDFGDGEGVVAFDYLEMTVSANTWALEGLLTTGTLNTSTTISASGSLDTVLDAGTWGSDFYLSLQAQQNAANADRYTDFSLDAVSSTAIPELSHTSMMFGLMAMSFVSLHCLRRR